MKQANLTVEAGSEGLAHVVERNIQALLLRRRRDEIHRSRKERIAYAITRFTGTMEFVYLHLVIFGLWVAINVGWVPGVLPIFLSTFVLISQNRMPPRLISGQTWTFRSVS
jgi:uncharacterized membrane protein